MFPRTWLVEFPYSKAHDETVNEKETLEAVGNLIQTARMEMQISQIQFADRVGVNVQTLRTMERGGRITQSVAQAKVEKGLGDGCVAVVDECCAEEGPWGDGELGGSFVGEVAPVGAGGPVVGVAGVVLVGHGVSPSLCRPPWAAQPEYRLSLGFPNCQWPVVGLFLSYASRSAAYL